MPRARKAATEKALRQALGRPRTRRLTPVQAARYEARWKALTAIGYTTQQAVADAMSCGQQMVSGLLYYRSTSDVLERRMAELAGVPVDEFFPERLELYADAPP